MEETLQQTAEKLQADFQKDPARAMKQFIEFAGDYANNAELEHQAILLKLEYSRTADAGKSRELIDRMIDLVNTIVAAYEQTVETKGQVPEGKKLELLTEHFRKQQSPRKVICQTENLTKEFKARNNGTGFILKDVNLELREGEITGVVGENGNGKTTLFRLIVGELAPSAGKLTYGDHLTKGGRRKNWFAIKKQIAYVPQELEPWYGSLLENLQYEAASHQLTGRKNQRAVDYIIQRMGLQEHQDKKWKELSGGFKVRFALARALIWRPKLMVIDEPLANLDFKAQLIVLNDLRDLAKSLRYPMSLLISSQHLQEIEQVSDRILFLNQGEVAYYGDTENIGSDRKYNTFELETDINRATLEQKLEGLDYKKVVHNGLVYIITTPLKINHQQLLAHLLAKEVPVHFFRDISQSAKKLFV